MAHTTSSSEHARQQALDSYRLVDTLPEAAYDDVVRLASLICHVPMALVTFIDHDRQWFKAKLGVDAQETSRDVAFCDYAIRSPDALMQVRDAREDPRFADNPLVTGEMGIRFYAGVPLVTPGGEALGTVCVIDRTPRELDEQQKQALQSLARITVALLEARRLEFAGTRADSERTFRERGPTPSPVSSIGAVAILQIDGLGVLRAAQGAETAKRLQAGVERTVQHELVEGDVISPHGDNEFLLLLQRAEDVDGVLSRIRIAVRDMDGAPSGTTLSIGAATATGEDVAMETLFLRADAALTQARSQGGDRSVVLPAA